MSLLMTLPIPALQEDFTERVFSDRLHSFFQKREDASNDLGIFKRSRGHEADESVFSEIRFSGNLLLWLSWGP